uniref:PEST proteolytic signal-containing nuclear protein n=1 Tax=Arion vulgaris TaxID=1028688 RepID=A0A0B6ZP78_9EUPU
MADVYDDGADSSSDQDGEAKGHSAEKRRKTEPSDDAVPTKKISISLGAKPAVSQKITFNLAAGGPTKMTKVLPVQSKPSKTTLAAPIKMSLNPSQKTKEPPPIVQKSALAARVFDDSDESDGEEMPPEAKMRMKNIGRDTPTASGPNSYGKGKQGFIDRQKIIEKQLKADMEKVSGDNRSLHKTT